MSFFQGLSSSRLLDFLTDGMSGSPSCAIFQYGYSCFTMSRHARVTSLTCSSYDSMSTPRYSIHIAVKSWRWLDASKCPIASVSLTLSHGSWMLIAARARASNLEPWRNILSAASISSAMVTTSSEGTSDTRVSGSTSHSQNLIASGPRELSHVVTRNGITP